MNIRILLTKWAHQRHFFAGFCIPCFFLFILLLGGFRNVFIIISQDSATATVTDVSSNGRGRSSIHYQYEVNGVLHTGSGAPDHAPLTPPYGPGTTYEIRYSTLIPSFSTAQNPWTIFGQFLVGSLFLLWADFMATRKKGGATS